MLTKAVGVLGLGAKAMGSRHLSAGVLEGMVVAAVGRHLRWSVSV
jgi:hypothetical protein